MSDFQRDFRNLVAPDLCTAFGECLRVIPMVRKPNYSPQPDTSRREFTVRGVFHWRSVYAVRDGSDRQRLQDDILTRNPCANLPLRDLPWAPRLADVIVREETGHRFEITSTHPDGVAFLELGLVQIGTHDFEIGGACT